MLKEAILKPIWNWQITIPQAWRKSMWVDGKYVKARFEGNKVIIESLEDNQVDWDVRKISLDEMNEETINAIKESEKNYRKGNKDAFLSHNDFWKDV